MTVERTGIGKGLLSEVEVSGGIQACERLILKIQGEQSISGILSVGYPVTKLYILLFLNSIYVNKNEL